VIKYQNRLLFTFFIQMWYTGI